MLKYTINRKNNTPLLKELFNSDSDVTFLSDGTIKYDDNFVKTGDTIRFIRKSCDKTYIADKSVISNSNDSFKIEMFDDIRCVVKECAELSSKSKYSEPANTKYVKISINNPHNIIDNSITDCNAEISEYIYGAYDKYDKDKKRCIGDYVLYNGIFLYKITNIDENNKYVLNSYSAFLNNSAITLCIDGDWYDKEDARGINWEISNGRMFLKGCTIPINAECKNDLYTFIWKGNYNYDKIIENLPSSYVTYKDELFFTDNGEEITLKDGVSVSLFQNLIKLNNALTENFATNLFQEDNINNSLVNRIVGKNTNEIIDYEKQIFEPIYNDGDVKSITFNLHFRTRDNYDEWKVVDGGFWNNYPNRGEAIEGIDSPNQADLLGYLGFTDDDVYYQKEKIKQSFLRLSFYDSKDRRNQALLTYSTIFMDSNELFSKYVKKKDEEDVEGECVFNENGERICASFTCKNKYNYSASSEGFYLYLFPNLLEMLPDVNGAVNGEKEIYLKVEFNHAKYGVKVPFVLTSANPVSPGTNFKYSYDNGNYIDMPQLYKDMYTPIRISYDDVNKRYAWKFAGDVINNNGDIILNLFEPRVNN